MFRNLFRRNKEIEIPDQEIDLNMGDLSIPMDNLEVQSFQGFRMHRAYMKFFANNYFETGRYYGANFGDSAIHDTIAQKLKHELIKILKNIINERLAYINTMQIEYKKLGSELVIMNDYVKAIIKSANEDIEQLKLEIELTKQMGGDLQIALLSLKSGFTSGAQDRFYRLFVPKNINE